MRDVVQEIQSGGAELVVVGNGTVEQARAFVADHHLTFPVFTDPTRESYRRAALRRGLWSTLAPGAVWRGLTAYRRGHRQTRIEGDALQQGGVFVIARGGELVYTYVSRAAGDHPPPAEILAALASLAPPAPLAPLAAT